MGIALIKGQVPDAAAQSAVGSQRQFAKIKATYVLNLDEADFAAIIPAKIMPSKVGG
jgi:hypothetical protein